MREVVCDTSSDIVRWLLRLARPARGGGVVHLQGPRRDHRSCGYAKVALTEIRELCKTLPHAAIVRIHEYLPPTLKEAAVQRRSALTPSSSSRYAAQAGGGRAEGGGTGEARACEAAKGDARGKGGGGRGRRWRGGGGGRGGGEEDEEEDEAAEEELEAKKAIEEEAAGSGAVSLVSALNKLGDGSDYKGRMDILHSVLVLTNVALAAEPVEMRHCDRSGLDSLKRKLNMLKQRAQRYRGAIDYHGLECESLASYLGNKIELLFLAGEEA